MYREDTIQSIIQQYQNVFSRNIDKSKLNNQNYKISNIIYYNDLNAIRQSIQDWVSARIIARYAFSPNWTDLIRVFDYVKLDCHVFGIINSVKQKIKAKEFQVLGANGEINQDLTKGLQATWFSKYLDYAIEAIFYPYSLIELGEWTQKGFYDIKLIKREYVIPQWESVKMFLYGTAVPSYNKHWPQTGVQFAEMGDILKDPSTYLLEYIKSPERINDYILVECPLHDLGLLDMLAPHAIAKMQGLSFNIDYLQKFVVPFIHGKTNLNDNLRRKNMEDLVTSEWGGSGGATTDLEDELHFLNQPSGSTAFQDFFRYANNEMTKAILSAVGITDEKSYVGSSESGERLANTIVQSYCNYLELNINDDLLWRLALRDRRYTNSRFDFVYKETIEYKDRVDSIVKLAEKFTLDEDEVSGLLDMTVKNKQNPFEEINKKQQQKKSDKFQSKIDWGYTDYPKEAIENAKKALKYMEIKRWDDGINIITEKLINKSPLSKNDLNTLEAIANSVKDEKNKPYSESDKSVIWDSLGGNEGVEWAIKKLRNGKDY